MPRKPKCPGRYPDEQFSQHAFQKMKEEIEEMKNMPDPSSMSGAGGGEGGALSKLIKKCVTAAGDKHHGRHDAPPEGGIFHEYVRDFTQSKGDEARRRRGPADHDLRKSRLNLSSSSRFTKLDEETQFRSNPHWVEEHKELVEKHGSWFRVKSAQDRARQREQEKSQVEAQPQKKQGKHTNLLARQLRELQREFATLGTRDKPLPVPMKFGVKRLAAVEGDDFRDTRPQKAVYKFLEWSLMSYGSLMDTFNVIDRNNNGNISRREFHVACRALGFLDDCDTVFNSLDTDNNGTISVREFCQFKPFMEEILDNLDEQHSSGAFANAFAMGTPESKKHESEGTPEHQDHHLRGRASTVAHVHKGPGHKLIEKYHLLQDHRKTVAIEENKKKKELIKGALPSIDMPQTCSLTVFRNGDKHHTGNVVFLKTIPSSLANLYVICDKIVRPVVGTVQQLLDMDLRPLKSLDDLQHGARYLAKGPEALLPPPAFWGIPVESMRRQLLPKPAKSSEEPAEHEGPDESSHSLERIGAAPKKERIGPSHAVGPFMHQNFGLQKAVEREMKEIDVLKAEGQSLKREIMSSTTSVSTHAPTPLNTQMDFMNRTTGSFMNQTASSGGWSKTKGSTPGSRPYSSASRPLTLFQISRNPDCTSRKRDREWRVYERALGDITYTMDNGRPPTGFEESSFPQLRSVQSTPALFDLGHHVPPKPGMEDKATVTTPEFQMQSPSLPNLTYSATQLQVKQM